MVSRGVDGRQEEVVGKLVEYVFVGWSAYLDVISTEVSLWVGLDSSGWDGKKPCVELVVVCLCWCYLP